MPACKASFREGAGAAAGPPPTVASGCEPGRAAAAARPGYSYEALSAASDGSEPEEAQEYTALDMEASGGGPSPRGSAKVNFPPEVEVDTRRAPAAAYHRSRGRSMSAWSDISRSSIRFEERSVEVDLLVTSCLIDILMKV